MIKFKLEHVHYMPKVLNPGILYVSKEFNTAAHLCACGCGSKVRTPLTPTEWSLEETKSGPTLFPSIGNWQLKCKSHYWIINGEIRWAEQWTLDQILMGRRNEEARRRLYYDATYQRKLGIMNMFLNWIKKLFKLDR